MPSTDDVLGIQGFLVPVYSDDEIPGREARHALTPHDLQKVAEGYACPRCLADFGQYRPVCPVCGHERDIHEDIVRAYDWEQELQAREKRMGEVQRTPRRPAHREVERIMGRR